MPNFNKLSAIVTTERSEAAVLILFVPYCSFIMLLSYRIVVTLCKAVNFAYFSVFTCTTFSGTKVNMWLLPLTTAQFPFVLGFCYQCFCLCICLEFYYYRDQTWFFMH